MTGNLESISFAGMGDAADVDNISDVKLRWTRTSESLSFARSSPNQIYYDHDIGALDREDTWKEYARREIVILLRERIEAEVMKKIRERSTGTHIQATRQCSRAGAHAEAKLRKQTRESLKLGSRNHSNETAADP
ncbi:hypothetical protein CORC01_02171 [Colletotrichum orchidophilum]|uniref:Uncharacterized protein n=1 Tax=Colletotrichum orchidophilum TaxID=1209926 RepID=A0A1G4BME3_9PEZI|nr:uncharacterized protein CORC01_02171 [Colletotrichum orchidophilum]OHF02476.1 hypothetical protein CORC01_02171 [Colletotrichum orchidophilum]